MPDELIEQYRYFRYLAYQKSAAKGEYTPIQRSDIPKYFDGQNFTSNYYKEIMFSPTINRQIYENLDKYKEYYNELEIAFIEKFHGNNITNMLYTNAGLTADNLSDYFYIENSQIMLSPKGTRTLFDSKEWECLASFPNMTNRLKELGLSENEQILFNFYNKIDNKKYRESFISVLNDKKEIFEFNKEELDNFFSMYNLIKDKLDKSNSPELVKFKSDFIIQLMDNPNPKQSLDIIDGIYSKSDLPDIGKSYLVFKTLHPNYNSFEFDDDSLVSPVLKNAKSDSKRDTIIYSDLIKCAMGSNNRTIKEYLMNIKNGNKLFTRISNNEIEFENLTEEEKYTLKIYSSHLFALYNNSKAGKENPKNSSSNIEKDILELEKLFSTTQKYDLPDRIVRMFCFCAGIKSFEEAIKYINSKVEYGNNKGITNAQKIASNGLTLEVGDYVKGLGTDGIKYFSTILQNGSIAKEFLGIGATSDLSPLDTDLSKIPIKKDTIKESIDQTISGSFGPLWFVLKNDDRFDITRNETEEKKEFDNNKMETFRIIDKNAYGIRTGFPTTEIDYIIIDNEDIDNLLPKIKHEIALNGFYIPVVDNKEGKLIFKPNEFKKLREKMAGLQHYDAEEFKFSNN